MEGMAITMVEYSLYLHQKVEKSVTDAQAHILKLREEAWKTERMLAVMPHFFQEQEISFAKIVREFSESRKSLEHKIKKEMAVAKANCGIVNTTDRLESGIEHKPLCSSCFKVLPEDTVECHRHFDSCVAPKMALSYLSQYKTWQKEIGGEQEGVLATFRFQFKVGMAQALAKEKARIEAEIAREANKAMQEEEKRQHLLLQQQQHQLQQQQPSHQQQQPQGPADDPDSDNASIIPPLNVSTSAASQRPPTPGRNTPRTTPRTAGSKRIERKEEADPKPVREGQWNTENVDLDIPPEKIPEGGKNAPSLVQ